MAYNRRNILQRIIEVQRITLEHTRRGVTQKWVFENVIQPRFCISKSCYNAYLATNAKAELRTISDKESKQLELF